MGANIEDAMTVSLAPSRIACSFGFGLWFALASTVADQVTGTWTRIRVIQDTGVTPLLAAAELGHHEIVHLLLSNGAKVNEAPNPIAVCAGGLSQEALLRLK